MEGGKARSSVCIQKGRGSVWEKRSVKAYTVPTRRAPKSYGRKGLFRALAGEPGVQAKRGRHPLERGTPRVNLRNTVSVKTPG